jgi:hypothetical protein
VSKLHRRAIALLAVLAAPVTALALPAPEGAYRGATAEGLPIWIEFGPRRLGNFEFFAYACGERQQVGGIGDEARIGRRGRFRLRAAWSGNLMVLAGRVRGATATGRVRIRNVDAAGRSCDSGFVRFRVRKPARGAVAVAASRRDGTYRGHTAQGFPMQVRIRKGRYYDATLRIRDTCGKSFAASDLGDGERVGRDGRFHTEPDRTTGVEFVIRGRIRGRRLTGVFRQWAPDASGRICKSGRIGFSLRR